MIRKPRYHAEESLQIAYVQWLDLMIKMYPSSLLKFGFHCPNGGKRSIKTAMTLKRMGARAGVPDFQFHAPRNGKGGLIIEFKSAKGKLSPDQKDWIEYFLSINYLVLVTSSLNEAIEITRQHFNLK